MKDARLLLGAMIALPGVLEACAELVDPMAWDGDERIAVLLLVGLRAQTTDTSARIERLAALLRRRNVRPLDVMLPAMELLVDAPPLRVDDFVRLARDLSTPEVPACSPSASP